MKQLTLVLLLVSAAFAADAQSESYRALRRKFSDSPEVKSYKLNALVMKILVSVVSREDDEIARALKDVKHVRVMTIPKEEFILRDLSVNGFKSYLAKDHYELMTDIRNHGDKATFYHRVEGHRNRYFAIIEESDEVVAIEMKGHIDPAIFNEEALMSIR